MLFEASKLLNCNGRKILC